MSSYVGFANLPNQVHRKTVKRGFEFALMVVGESGLGKSTLINSLFLTDLYAGREKLAANDRIKSTLNIQTSACEIEERGVKLKLTVVDTPGFGDGIDNSQCFEPILKYINQQFENYLRDESGLNRRNILDNRVHCCFYFINPSGHGLKPIDVKFMKMLHEKVNIVPVIGKADSLTKNEVAKLKKKVLEEMKQHEIHLYDFPDCDQDEDEEFRNLTKQLKGSMPYAVVGSNTVLEVKGKKTRGRAYPWGVVEVENPSHCDFSNLRTMLITYMQDLKEVTQDVHYENYRANTLSTQSTGAGESQRGNNKTKIEPSTDKDALLKEKEAELLRMKEMFAQMQAQMQNQQNDISSGITRSTNTDHQQPEANIQVAVRVRPLNAVEIAREDKVGLEFPENGVLWATSQETTKSFTFNTIFDENASQSDVFNDCGITDLIRKALDGFSCTAFAFGQTGSGKTYTITGPFHSESNDAIPDQSLFGLIPRSFQYLLSELEKRNEEYVTRMTFLEVYNEKVKDLLNPSRARDSLPVRWSSNKGFYVENIFNLECENLEEMMSALQEGLQNRKIGAHSMNDYSSRSHTMLTIQLDSEINDPDDELPILKNGKISFVDLAGSERVKETNSTGEALTESQNINKSLLTLGNCIAALGDPKKRNGHIPYRDSKLTKLLADSLGGDGFTLMLACVSPSSNIIQDTLNTLRYAKRAKNIKNKPIIKMDPREQLIISMKREMKLLKAENNYFRAQLNIPSSDSQEVLTPSQIEGVMSTDGVSGYLSPAIGADTISSIKSSSVSSINEKQSISEAKSEEEVPRGTTAMYAMSASIGLYDMLQEYITENETLRQQNIDLFKSRQQVERDHELISMQNESLKQKIGNIERALSSTSISIHSDDTLTEENQSKDFYYEKQSSFGSRAFEFPPIRTNSYPNLISHSVDLAAEVEREHKKIKEERARKEREKKQKEESENKMEVNKPTNKQKENMEIKQKRETENSDNSGSDMSSKLNPKLKPLKKSVFERETIRNSYAAKFAFKKGITTSNGPTPHFSNIQQQQNKNIADAKTHYNIAHENNSTVSRGEQFT
eukprot:gene14072-15539_t